MSRTLNIRLLGGFSLTYGEHPVAEITGGRSQALLAYLVLHQQTSQTRQRIAFQLWPESMDDQARANLRKELSRLRQRLPNPDKYLQVDAKTLQWLPQGSFTLDVAEFEAAVKLAEHATDRTALRSQLNQALELYRGDLLPDLDDMWVLAERERLQQLYIRILEQLVQVAEAQQDYQTALTHAQHLLRVDELNEATYATLMRLHGLSGDRAKALQVYHQCMTVLREALGVDPSTTTCQLYEQLLMGEPLTEENFTEENTTDLSPYRNSKPFSPVLAQASPPFSQTYLALFPLVGREPEWASIQQWANAMLCWEQRPNLEIPASIPKTSAEAKMLLLLGEPGIGKTRLLEELRSFAQANQAQVIWGHGFAAEIMRPYGIWIDALRASENLFPSKLPAELGFLLPELGRVSQAPPDLSHLFDAVVQLLIQWANQAPLLVLLDDIQWIDEASSALLHYAMRLLRSLPVLFACTARAQELTENLAIAQVVQALRREQRLQTLELLPLDREQTADLIRSTHAVAPSELSLALVNQVFIDSGGNPLFALEIARSLGQKQSSHGNTVEALICDRLRQLDGATQEVLPWAAALGRSFKPSTLAQVADYPVTKLLLAIAELEQQAIIRPSNSLDSEMGYDFAHDILRQVVYQQLSQPGRQLIHRQIAHKLKQHSTPNNSLASDIAYHASLGGDRALAASAALAAAEQGLKLFAYAEATELAQQGLQHCRSLDPQTRLPLQIELLRVCAIAGITEERATQLETEIQQLHSEATSLGLNEVEAIALESLMILQFERNNFTSVHQHSLQAAASQFASPATAARMLAFSGSCLAEIGRDMARAEALLLEAQSLAARVGLEMGDIFGGLGCVRHHHGDYAEARSLLQQAWRQTQARQDHWRECNYLRYLAMLELEAGEPMAALSYCDEMLIVAANIQQEGSEAAVATALAALVCYRLGQPKAEAALTQAIATLQQVDAKRMLAYVLIGAAEVDLNCDRPELAVSRAEVALKNAQIVNHPSEIALAWAILIQGLLTLGEHQRATDQVELLHQTLDFPNLSLAAKTAVSRLD